MITGKPAHGVFFRAIYKAALCYEMLFWPICFGYDMDERLCLYVNKYDKGEDVIKH